MKQFMGFKAAPAATVNGTNLHPDATTTKATTPEKLGTALPGFYGKSDDTGKLIMINAAADFLNIKTFIIARGNAKGMNPLDTDDTAEGAILSDEIDRKTLTVEKYPHTTAAAKVITLGGAASNLIGGVTPAPANSVAGVTIVDNAPTIMSDWKTRTYEVKAAGLDAKAVADALVIKINADPARLVNASATGATVTGALVLTHRTKGKTFDAHGTDETVCANCPKVVTTQPAREDNSIVGVRELELECHGYQGGTRRGDGQLGDILPYTQVEIDDPNGVLMYHLTWERKVNRQGVPVDANASRFLRLYLSVPTGNGTMITAIDTLLSAALADEATASASETPLLIRKEEAAAKENEEVEKKIKEAKKEAEKKANEAEREAEKQAREDAREQGGAEPKNKK